ncbi:MAG: hypothetical protein KGL39_43090 [Patescibacteria group bacterium]|nr:hypothetical protein [Patescibacteria group bacterium]
MSFVKLDCGILESSLWVDRAAREVFITALLMARPCVLDGPMEQLDVKTMLPTGWIVPPGSYGWVDAAGIGICRRALIDQEEGLNALERLSSSESESRSSEFDGRRLARVNGGYIILNYARFRDRDDTAAERMRKYRQRIALRRNGSTVTRNVTHAEAEAEAEADKKIHTAAAPPRAPEFLELQGIYPKRAGDQAWEKAARAVNARLREGHTWSEILEGARRYAAYCQASESVGTQYVKQAASFVGPDKHFLSAWSPPPSKAQLKQDANLDAARQWITESDCAP